MLPFSSTVRPLDHNLPQSLLGVGSGVAAWVLLGNVAADQPTPHYFHKTPCDSCSFLNRVVHDWLYPPTFSRPRNFCQVLQHVQCSASSATAKNCGLLHIFQIVGQSRAQCTCFHTCSLQNDKAGNPAYLSRISARMDGSKFVQSSFALSSPLTHLPSVQNLWSYYFRRKHPTMD